MTALARRRLIFAHYFLWFGLPARSGDWGNWEWRGPGRVHRPGGASEHSADDPQNGRLDIAAIHYPLLSPYDSSDRGALERHVQWASQSGIDFFAVDWYGPPSHVGSTPKYARVDRNFSTLLNVCARRRFKTVICYEEKLLFERLPRKARPAQRIATGVDHLNYAFRQYGSHPGYLRLDGRPVLVVWGDHSLPNEEWAAILEPIRRRHNPIVIYSYFFKNDREQINWYRGVSERRIESPAVEGLYPWLLLGSKKSIFQRLQKMYERLNELKRRRIIDFVTGSVWPGFNDSGVSAWGAGRPRIIRDDRRLYEMTWEFAMKYRADWISIATWNDWNEGSQIEPDADRGERLLDLTSRYTRQFK